MRRTALLLVAVITLALSGLTPAHAASAIVVQGTYTTTKFIGVPAIQHNSICYAIAHQPKTPDHACEHYTGTVYDFWGPNYSNSHTLTMTSGHVLPNDNVCFPQPTTNLYACFNPPDYPAAKMAASAATVQPTKVLYIGGENTGLKKLLANMPYAKGLSQTYGSATKLADSSPNCPSLVHYIIEGFGQGFGICDDAAPAKHPLAKPTVFGDAIANGRTAHAYVQDADSNCPLTNTGTYHKVRHDGGGWAYSTLTAERAACKQFNTPMETTLQPDIDAGQLPNVGWLAPSNRDNAHSPSTPADFDAFLRTWVPKLMAGPDYQAGDLVIIVGTDEGSGTLPFIPIHPSLHGVVNAQALDQTAIYRMFERYGGTTLAGTDALAGFGL